MDRSNSFASNLSISRSGSVYSTSSYASGIDAPLDKNAYLNDNSCLCCGSSFSPDLLVKHCCTFCCRGVCPNCFTKQFTRPDTQEPSDICDNCFDRLLNKGVNQLEKLRGEIYELKEKYEHEKRATLKEMEMQREMEEELESIINEERKKGNSSLKEIQILKENNSKLEQDIQIMELEYQDKLSISSNLEQKIKTIQDEAEVLKVKYHNSNATESLKAAVLKAKAEYEEIQREISAHEMKNESSKAEELELEVAKNQLIQKLENAKEICENLSKKATEMENDEVEQQKTIETLQKSIDLVNNKDAGSFVIPKTKFALEFSELSRQLDDRQARIEKLKNEIRKHEGSVNSRSSTGKFPKQNINQ